MQTRVLVVRNGSLGDTMIVVPSFLVLRKQYSKVDLLVAQNSCQSEISVARLLKNLELVDDVLIYKPNTFSNIITNYKQLKYIKGRYDAIYNFMPERTYIQSILDYFVFKILARVKIFRRLPPYKLTRWSKEIYKNKSLKEWQKFIKLVGDEDFNSDLIDLRNKLAKSSLNYPKGRVFIAPGSAMPAKIWPIENYIQLVSELIPTRSVNEIVLIGSPDEYEHAEKIRLAVNDAKVQNHCGKMSIETLYAASQSSDLFIGNDSGLLHLFSLMGCKTIGVYSARDSSEKWLPVGHCDAFRADVECKGCMLTICPNKNDCLVRVDVESVISKAKSYL